MCDPLLPGLSGGAQYTDRRREVELIYKAICLAAIEAREPHGYEQYC